MRSSLATARAIELASQGVDDNHVFEKIIDDLTLISTEGVQGVHPYGRLERIFIDWLGFYGDYSAATAVTE